MAACGCGGEDWTRCPDAVGCREGLARQLPGGDERSESKRGGCCLVAGRRERCSVLKLLEDGEALFGEWRCLGVQVAVRGGQVFSQMAVLRSVGTTA